MKDQPVLRSNKQNFLKIFVLVLIGCFCFINFTSAMPPPQEQKNLCLKSGGVWLNNDCWCPPFAKYDRLECYTKTFQESCEEKGGQVMVYKKAIPFGKRKCTKEGEEIKVNPQELSYAWWIFPVLILTGLGYLGYKILSRD